MLTYHLDPVEYLVIPMPTRGVSFPLNANILNPRVLLLIIRGYRKTNFIFASKEFAFRSHDYGRRCQQITTSGKKGKMKMGNYRPTYYLNFKKVNSLELSSSGKSDIKRGHYGRI